MILQYKVQCRLFILLSCLYSFAFSQSSSDPWLKGIGGMSNDAARSICVGENRKVFVTGYFEGTADFDPGPLLFNLISVGSNDVFVICLDSIGDLIWAKQIGGLLSDDSRGIKTDTEGNVYVCGNYEGTVDFDPGPKTFNLVSSGYKDIFIIKLNKNGDFLWAKTMGGSGNDIVSGMALDEAGNIITTGQYESSFSSKPDFDPGHAVYNLPAAVGADVFISKIDKNGNFGWAKNLSGNDSQVANAISLDTYGNICVVGWFRISVDFDPGDGIANLQATGHFANVFVCQLDSEGNFIWAKSMGGKNSSGTALAVTNDHNANIIISGEFNSFLDFDFDPGPNFSTLDPRGFQDIFVCKLDSIGNYIWARSMGGANSDFPYGIAVDNVGSIYSTGITGGKADFDPGTGTFNPNFYGGWDGFINKLNTSGEFEWTFSFGGTVDDFGNAIAIDHDGCVYTTGSFKAQANFSTHSESIILQSNGLSDIFILKTGGCALLKSNKHIEGPDRICERTNAIYFIDSIESVIKYSWIVPNGWSGSSDTDTIKLYSGNKDGLIFLELTNYCGSRLHDSLHIIVNPKYYNSKNISLCSGDTFMIGTTVYTTSGLYELNYKTSFGCDSIINLSINVSNPIDTSVKKVSKDWLEANLSGAKYQWIDCLNGKLAIPGETKKSFITNKDGSYAVIITQLNCSDTSSCYTIGKITNTEASMKYGNITLFPNPVMDDLNFELSDNEVKYLTFEIRNVLGEVILTHQYISDNQRIDLKSINPGIYIICVKNKDGFLYKPFVKI